MTTYMIGFLDRPEVRRTFVVLIGIIAIAYFFQITSASARGYELKKLSDQLNTVNSETDRVELTIAEESSAQNLQKRLEALGLHSPDKIDYIHVDTHSVAVK